MNTNISPNISSFVPQEQTSLTPEKSPTKNEEGDGPPSTDRLVNEISIFINNNGYLNYRKDTLPSSSDHFDLEDNITPTWGSNLMKVNDDVLSN